MRRAPSMKGSPLTYAIGDVHGCVELLRQALSRIQTHARGRDHTTILLGDYVDRGKHSKEVIDLLLSVRTAGPLVCLRGNHEEMMMRVHRNRSAPLMEQWFEVGGRATLRSYAGEDEASLDHVPARHWSWLASRPLILEEAGHVFVHAGIDPRRSILEQEEREFLWIRRRFLAASPEEFVDRRHVVHGHTPQWEGKPDAAIPEFRPNRTNLDTGAYATGVLSVGIFDVERASGPIDLLSVH